MLKSCLFAGIFFSLLIFGKFVTTFGLHFYDFLFLGVIVTQIILLLTKFETRDEVKIILIYHILGFVMEAFKTSPAIGAWAYPDPGFFTLLGVPLYSGFMYSAVGSFIFKAWDYLKLKFTNFPKFGYIVPIAILVYVNFFSHHFLPDFRYILLIFIISVSWNTWAWIKIDEKYQKMPVLLGLLLIGFFLWLAENISTFLGAWVYPNQAEGWHLVSWHKILSWFLLFIVSIVVVSIYKMNRGKNKKKYEYR